MKLFLRIIMGITIGTSLAVSAVAVPRAQASKKKHLKIVKITFSQRDAREKKLSNHKLGGSAKAELAASTREAQRVRVSMEQSIPDSATTGAAGGI